MNEDESVDRIIEKSSIEELQISIVFHFADVADDSKLCSQPISIMRQLKGKVKETNKQKKERKKEFIENKQRVFTIVLPTIGVLFVLMVLYVYFKASRPKTNVEF
ncbi:hypothetical protein FOCC_FOCC012873 [Frankliniella occidentalis]|nr:hypothetical protein FOCC_FOCC012873 [Frankliniella occidentalis]